MRVRTPGQGPSEAIFKFIRWIKDGVLFKLVLAPSERESQRNLSSRLAAFLFLQFCLLQPQRAERGFQGHVDAHWANPDVLAGLMGSLSQLTTPPVDSFLPSSGYLRMVGTPQLYPDTKSLKIKLNSNARCQGNANTQPILSTSGPAISPSYCMGGHDN